MKVCTGCHELKPLAEFNKAKHGALGVSARCKDCFHEYYLKNKEHVKSRTHAWAAANGAHIKAQGQRFYEQNRESILEDRAEYYEVNRELVLARVDLSAKRNAERSATELSSDQERLHPDGLKRCRKCKQWLNLQAFSLKRRTADGLNPNCRDCDNRGVRTIASFDERGLDKCVYCMGAYEHADHVLPTALGGLDLMENLVPACARCNHKKRDKNPWLWLSICRPGEDHEALLDSWGIEWRGWRVERI